ncbi:peptidase C14 [Polyporus arcularius HHB13444]|uniref:Peptidase C14 n=1 Tax=Polyporus arcularius HHB13444 TaxID=1314778 RepID=A0A5C3PFW9_9APHY|nr:peptidase C14 [Polyporus arcularius HHB13444]
MPGISGMGCFAKKALLIGIEYASSLREHDQTLPGAHKDPFLLRDVLIERYGYSSEDIVILIDDESGRYVWPTRENIISAMSDLVKDARPGDHFVFSFSGHGAQTPNEDGAEDDGYDETLVTVDTSYDPTSETYSGYIKDDLVRQLLVDALPPGARLVMIFDCCHSGTASDLPVVFADNLTSPCSPIATSPRLYGSRGFALMQYNPEDWNAPWAWINTRMGRMRGNSLPLQSPLPDVTSWSACMDSQVTYGGRRGGMFIKAFTDAIRTDPHQTHAELLQSIRRELAKRMGKRTLDQMKKDIDQPLTSPRAQLTSLKNISLFHTRFDM